MSRRSRRSVALAVAAALFAVLAGMSSLGGGEPAPPADEGRPALSSRQALAQIDRQCHAVILGAYDSLHRLGQLGR